MYERGSRRDRFKALRRLLTRHGVIYYCDPSVGSVVCPHTWLRFLNLVFPFEASDSVSKFRRVQTICFSAATHEQPSTKAEKDMSDSEDLAESPPNSPTNQSESDGSLSSGESVHGQVAPIKCMWDTCGEWFNTLEELASHVGHTHALAGKGGLFYCGWKGCSRGDRGFNARYKMLVHVRTHTNEKPHQCFICDKSFSRAENLKIHARSHTGERPYVCPVAGCGKAYSNSSDRFKHTRTHSVDKPYVCKVPGCPKRYTDPSSLRKHVKTYRHFPSQAGMSVSMKADVDWGTRPPQMTDFAARVSRRTPSPEPVKAEIDPYPSSYYPTDLPREVARTEVPDNMEHAPSISPQPGCCVPVIHPNSLSQSSFSAWPGFLQWYLPEQQQQFSTTCYSEQETPLDLTSPIRLQHRV